MIKKCDICKENFCAYNKKSRYCSFCRKYNKAAIHRLINRERKENDRKYRKKVKSE